MVDGFNFSNHDIVMGFLLGVPQLSFGFICITIGSKTTRSVTVGLLMLTETIFAPLWGGWGMGSDYFADVRLSLQIFCEFR